MVINCVAYRHGKREQHVDIAAGSIFCLQMDLLDQVDERHVDERFGDRVRNLFDVMERFLAVDQDPELTHGCLQDGPAWWVALR